MLNYLLNLLVKIVLCYHLPNCMHLLGMLSAIGLTDVPTPVLE